jgi:hypothetical protein
MKFNSILTVLGLAMAIHSVNAESLRGGDLEYYTFNKDMSVRKLFDEPSVETCGSHGTYYDITDNLSGTTETGCTCDTQYYSLNSWCDYKQKDGYQVALLQFFLGGFQAGSFYTDPYELSAILAISAIGAIMIFKCIGVATASVIPFGFSFMCAIGYCIAIIWGSVNLFDTDYRDENDVPIYWSIHNLTAAVQVMMVISATNLRI